MDVDRGVWWIVLLLQDLRNVGGARKPRAEPFRGLRDPGLFPGRKRVEEEINSSVATVPYCIRISSAKKKKRLPYDTVVEIISIFLYLGTVIVPVAPFT